MYFSLRLRPVITEIYSWSLCVVRNVKTSDLFGVGTCFPAHSVAVSTWLKGHRYRPPVLLPRPVSWFRSAQWHLVRSFLTCLFPSSLSYLSGLNLVWNPALSVHVCADSVVFHCYDEVQIPGPGVQGLQDLGASPRSDFCLALSST